MKNQNIVFIAIAFALAFALAPVTRRRRALAVALPPPLLVRTTSLRVSNSPLSPSIAPGISSGERSVHSSWSMKPALMFGATFVNFKISGTAVAGVDYVSLLSPAYIGQSGYGVISVATLPDPRGPVFRQSV